MPYGANRTQIASALFSNAYGVDRVQLGSALFSNAYGVDRVRVASDDFNFRAPELVATTNSNITDSAANDEVTGSVSWRAGDRILVKGSLSNNGDSGGTPLWTLSTPTATGLTFTLHAQENVNEDVNNACPVYFWTALAASDGSGAISAVTNNAPVGQQALIAVEVWRNCSGFGTAVTLDSSANKTVNLTRTQANSNVTGFFADWNAAGDATVNATPTGTVRIASATALIADFYSLTWGDQGAAGGPTAYGLTDHTGTVSMTAIVAEVFGITINPINWENGEGLTTFSWQSGGYIKPSAQNSDAILRYQGTTPAADQYSKVTSHAHTRDTTISSWLCAAVRWQNGAATGYIGAAVDESLGGSRFCIQEVTAGTFVNLATSTEAANLAAGETVTLEAEGTTLRCGSDRGGSDTQRVTTTDATITSGFWGVQNYETGGGAAKAEVTAFEGGNIGFGNWENGPGAYSDIVAAGGGVIAPSNNDSSAVIRRAAETYAADHYSRVTIEVNEDGSFPGAAVRLAAGTDDSYVGEPDVSGNVYSIYEHADAGGSLLASSGGAGGELPMQAGDVLTMEVEGITLRLGSDASGTDAQKLTTTDATLTAGGPGIHIYEVGTAVGQITAWDGGNIGFGNWENGPGGLGGLQYETGGQIKPLASATSSGMRRSSETYAADQYSKVTVGEMTPGGSLCALDAQVRMQEGDNSGYVGDAVGTDDNSDDGFKIYVVVSGSYTLLDEVVGTLDAEMPLSAGETVTLEVEGNVLRLGSNSGGSDVQKVTTTDGTYTSGSPGLGVFEQTGSATTQLTSWEGGEIEGGGVTAELTGTVTASITEADIVAGGKTIIITLTGDTFIP